MEVWRLLVDETVLTALAAGLPAWALAAVMAVCILVLAKGADCMIDGVVHLARLTGLPRIAIGATVVSLGTTAPEMFVSVMAAWMGNPGLALGNGVGSIICDTGLILGTTCLLTRVPVNRFILDRTGWIQVGAASLLVAIALLSPAGAGGGPVLGRWVGLLFLILLGGYLALSYAWAKQCPPAGEKTSLDEPISLGRCWGLILGGLVAIIAASRVLVPTAAEAAGRLGVPQDVIAATLVAFGTSLPELVTAISAVRKGHPEITIGNVVGADVLNCFFVIGAAAAARPLEVGPTFFLFHFPAMLLILYIFRAFIFWNRDGRFKRWQGASILGLYLIYVATQYAFELS